MEIAEPITNHVVEKSLSLHSIKRTAYTSLLGIFFSFVILGIGIITGYMYSLHNSYIGIKAKQATIPIFTNSNLLIFQNYGSNTQSTTHTITFTDQSGKILSTFKVKDTDPMYIPFTGSSNYISFSSGLITSSGSETNYSLIESNGKVETISSSLKNLLKTPNELQAFVIDNKYLLGFTNSECRDFEITDLLTGESQTLFTVSPIGQYLNTNALFIPNNISPDGKNISFIVNDEELDSHAVTTLSAVSYNITKGTFTIHPFPDNTAASHGIFSYEDTGLYQTSWDGNYLIYQSYEPNSNDQSGITHLYNVPEQKDYVLQTASSDSSLIRSPMFSADNKYLLMENGDLFSTQTGKLIKVTYNLDNKTYTLPSPIGWINNTTIGYVTSLKTSSAQNSPIISFSYNILTGKTILFQSRYGELMTILSQFSSENGTPIPTIIDTITPTTTPPQAVVPIKDESNWKTYNSTVDNLSFKYPPDWVKADLSIQSNYIGNTDQIALQSPDGIVKLNWVTELSGFGGNCQTEFSLAQNGACPLVTIIAKNPILHAPDVFLVAGTITRDGNTYEPFLAIQNSDGLTSTQRTMGYDMFDINGTNGGILFSTSGAYAGGPELSQQGALNYLNTPDIQTAEEIMMSLTYNGN